MKQQLFLQEYGIEEDLVEVFDEEVASKIMHAYANSELKKLSDVEKRKLLKEIEKYYKESYDVDVNYVSKQDNLVAYKVIV